MSTEGALCGRARDAPDSQGLPGASRPVAVAAPTARRRRRHDQADGTVSGNVLRRRPPQRPRPPHRARLGRQQADLRPHRAAVALAMEAENVSRGPGVARRGPATLRRWPGPDPWPGRKRSCGPTAALVYGRAARSSSRSRRAPRQTGPDRRSSRRHAGCRTARSAAADSWFRGEAAVLACAPACGFPPVALFWTHRVGACVRFLGGHR
jgi:hypothetical protein